MANKDQVKSLLVTLGSLALKVRDQRDRFSVALYATEERSPEDEKL